VEGKSDDGPGSSAPATGDDEANPEGAPGAVSRKPVPADVASPDSDSGAMLAIGAAAAILLIGVVGGMALRRSGKPVAPE
jgi:hypothetical protein